LERVLQEALRRDTGLLRAMLVPVEDAGFESEAV
jgi:hypothetical protein